MQIAGLVQRRSVYYFRKRVPLRLRAVVGQWIISKSLQTRAFDIAAVRFLHCDLALRPVLHLCQVMADLDPEYTKQYFHSVLRRWMGEDVESIGPGLPSSEVEIAEKMANRDGELYDIGLQVKWSDPKFDAALSGKDEQALMLRTAREHLRQIEAQGRGERVAAAFDPYFDGALSGQAGQLPSASPVATSTNDQRGQRIIAQPLLLIRPQQRPQTQPRRALRRWGVCLRGLRRRMHGIGTASGWQSSKMPAASCVTLLGRPTPLRIGAVDMRHVKDLLLRLPVNANKKAQYKGKPIPEQVRLADAAGDPDRISATTMNDRLKNIALWFDWAKGNHYIAENVFKGVTVKVPRLRQDKRTSYSDTQLQTPFGTPIYVGMQSQTHWGKADDMIARDCAIGCR